MAVTARIVVKPFVTIVGLVPVGARRCLAHHLVLQAIQELLEVTSADPAKPAFGNQVFSRIQH